MDVEDASLALAKVNLFTRLGWEHFPHPETVNVEKRTFRSVWLSTTTANAGDEYYDNNSQQYYCSLHSANTVSPTTPGDPSTVNPDWALSQAEYAADDWVSGDTYNVGDQARDPNDGNFYQVWSGPYSGSTSPSVTAANWGLLKPFIRSIDYDQTLNGVAQTSIGQLLYVWDRDPREAWVHRFPPLPMTFRMRTTYYQVLGCAAVVWAEFQTRAPVFAGPTRDDVTAYTTGTEVYDSVTVDSGTGDYWIANQNINPGESPTSVPAKWNKVTMPYYLAEFVAQSAYAQLVDKEQEQPENFTVQQAAGYPLLAAEIDHIERRQGQTRQLNVKLGRR